MPLPSSNKQVGDAGHTTDHNAIVTEVAAVQTTLNNLDSSTRTFTNKGISGATNDLSDIPYDAIPGLEADLSAIAAPGMRYVVYDTGLDTYPPRSSSGTSDPSDVVLWIGGPGPAKNGTGATGAVVGDLWLRTV